MADSLMDREFLSRLAVMVRFVGMQAAILLDVLEQHLADGGLAKVIDLDRPGTAAALDKGDNLLLGMEGGHFKPALPGPKVSVGLADESLIDLDNATVAAHGFGIGVFHGFADAMAHEPRGFEGDAQGPVKLIGANAFLARHHEEYGLQPDVQLDVAGLEDGADLHGKGLAAGIALVGAYAGAFARQLAATVHNAAMGAYAALRPYAGLYPVVCGLFIVEMGGVKDRHGYISFGLGDYAIYQGVRKV